VMVMLCPVSAYDPLEAVSEMPRLKVMLCPVSAYDPYDASSVYAAERTGGLPANGAAAIGNDAMPYPVRAKAIQLTYPSVTSFHPTVASSQTYR